MTVWWAPSLDSFRLHHPVLPNRVSSRQVQIGRFVRDLRDRFRVVLVSAGLCYLWRHFGGPVSASRNSVPGRQGSTADIRLLSHGSQTSAALASGVFGACAIVAGSTQALRTLKSCGLGHQITGTTARPFLHFLEIKIKPGGYLLVLLDACFVAACLHQHGPGDPRDLGRRSVANTL